MGRLVLITANNERLVTLDQAKTHCRCQHNLENDAFTAWIKAAEDYCQSYTSRALLTSTWQWIGFEFPLVDDEDAPIDLLTSPVQSITSVTYVDPDGDEVVLDAEDYQLEAQEIAPKLWPGVGTSWPETESGNVSAVTVEFLAGYTSRPLVPAQFTQAMLLMIGQWYQNRENAEMKPNSAADRLLDQVKSERYV